VNEKSSKNFSAFRDATRIKVLELLKKEEICGSDICSGFNMDHPSVSYHFQVLKRAGMVKSD